MGTTSECEHCYEQTPTRDLHQVPGDPNAPLICSDCKAWAEDSGLDMEADVCPDCGEQYETETGHKICTTANLSKEG